MDRLATSKEAASGGDVIPTAIYQDSLENLIPLSMDIYQALNSYIQNRESLAIEKRNPPSQSPNKLISEIKMILMKQRLSYQTLKWIVEAGK